MKEVEILGLILLLYDYVPKENELDVYFEYEGKKHFPLEVIAKPHNYLKRKGYFDKKERRPTLKFYQLLAKYGIKIKQLEEWQEEFEKTGHITQYDKLGNKKIL